MEDGVSYRETLEGLIERTRSPERRRGYENDLAAPPFPTPLLYLWVAFHRLRRRKANGFAPVAIEWGDIDAFVRNTGTWLTAFDIETIEMLDDLYLADRLNRTPAAPPDPQEAPS